MPFSPPALVSKPDAEREELRSYLGAAYDDTRLQRWQEVLDEEYAEIGDEARLYRTSEAYLYNLTAFAMSETKLPYLEELLRHVPRGGEVLDYGCGIGSDGLMLIDAGYRVSFADFENPSSRYLRWRLEQRGLNAPVYDLDREPPPMGFDGVYAFDVIEHVAEPEALLAEMESRARVVALNLLEDDAGDTPLHRSLPIPALVDRAARLRLLSYTRHHGGRSHLLVYSPDHARGAARRVSFLRARLGRLRRSS